MFSFLPSLGLLLQEIPLGGEETSTYSGGGSRHWQGKEITYIQIQLWRGSGICRKIQREVFAWKLLQIMRISLACTSRLCDERGEFRFGFPSLSSGWSVLGFVFVPGFVIKSEGKWAKTKRDTPTRSAIKNKEKINEKQFDWSSASPWRERHSWIWFSRFRRASGTLFSSRMPPARLVINWRYASMRRQAIKNLIARLLCDDGKWRRRR